jgi:hypothetical protein
LQKFATQRLILCFLCHILDSFSRGRRKGEGKAHMKRAPIPPPPSVVGGMLEKSDSDSRRMRKSSSTDMVASKQADDKAQMAAPPLSRLLSDPPDLSSYQNQLVSANGL